MKRFIFALLGSIVVIAGSISGATLQSAGVGMIAMYASDGNPAVTVGATCTCLVLSFILPSSSGRYAFVVFTEGICEKIQSALTEVYGSNAPSLRRTSVGYLEAITSPTNTAGTSQVQIDQGDGKIKQVRLKYIQRGLDTDIVTSKPAACVSDLEPTPKEQTVSITQQLYTRVMTFTEAQMRRLCEADSEYITGVMNARLDPFMVKLNRLLLQNASANFGNFYGGSNAVRNYNLLKTSGSSAVVDYYGEASLIQDLEKLELMGRPIVVGSDKLNIYTRMTGIGCCNQDGLNLAQAGNMDYYMDKYVTNELGTDHFVILIPGHIQLMTFNENVGEYAKENDVFSHGTLIDPKTGIKLDIFWNYDYCNRKYNLHFGVNYEMYYLPGNAFQYGDELYGFNGLLHGKATQS